MQNHWAEWAGALPWEQQVGETDKAYRAFATYRDMGTNRSLRKTTKIIYGVESDDDVTTYLRQIAKWSSANRWVERVNQYDAYNDYQRWSNRQEDIRLMEQRHASIAVQVQRTALEKLELLAPSDLSANDVIRFLEQAVKIERLARGEATNRSEVSGKDGAPLELAVTVEDLESKVLKLLEQRPEIVADES